MNQPVSHISLNSSRLIRLLSELAVTDVEHSYKDFGRRFGQLFVLKDSLKLAEMHSDLSQLGFEQRHIESAFIERQFLQQRKSIVDDISSYFIALDDSNSYRLQFPSLRIGASAEQLTNYAGYQGFYLNLQRVLDREVQHLHSYLRDAAAGLSPRLAKLVEIDITLGKALANQARSLLGLIPQLLGRRFEFLLQQHHQTLFNPADDDVANWVKSGAWLDQLRLDSHALLLAELDVRLQPAIGLLEAINEEASNQHVNN
jgi:hypothetical protein